MPYALTSARVRYKNNFDTTATAPVQVVGIAKQGRYSGFKGFVVLDSHTGAVYGMPRPEALLLISDLMEHSTRKERVCADH
jgi:hypothetical protein